MTKSHDLSHGEGNMANAVDFVLKYQNFESSYQFSPNYGWMKFMPKL